MNRDDIINKKFPHAFWGYDAEEVDLFLDEVIRELDRLHNELDMASLAAEAARQREERLKIRADKLRQMLIDHGFTDTGAAEGDAGAEKPADEGTDPGAETEEGKTDESLPDDAEAAGEPEDRRGERRNNRKKKQ